jgi:hypothetical protein
MGWEVPKDVRPIDELGEGGPSHRRKGVLLLQPQGAEAVRQTCLACSVEPYTVGILIM